jgi:hypothetical protein
MAKVARILELGTGKSENENTGSFMKTNKESLNMIDRKKELIQGHFF